MMSEPADGWRVIALQAVFGVVSFVVHTVMMEREVRFTVPSVRASVAMLTGEGRLFGVRAASGLYIHANTLILVVRSGTTAVAFFGGAERIVRASINLLQPLTQALLPRL